MRRTTIDSNGVIGKFENKSARVRVPARHSQSRWASVRHGGDRRRQAIDQCRFIRRFWRRLRESSNRTPLGLGSIDRIVHPVPAITRAGSSSLRDTVSVFLHPHVVVTDDDPSLDVDRPGANQLLVAFHGENEWTWFVFDIDQKLIRLLRQRIGKTLGHQLAAARHRYTLFRKVNPQSRATVILPVHRNSRPAHPAQRRIRGKARHIHQPAPKPSSNTFELIPAQFHTPPHRQRARIIPDKRRPALRARRLRFRLFAFAFLLLDVRLIPLISRFVCASKLQQERRRKELHVHFAIEG